MIPWYHGLPMLYITIYIRHYVLLMSYVIVIENVCEGVRRPAGCLPAAQYNLLFVNSLQSEQILYWYCPHYAATLGQTALSSQGIENIATSL